ncbi:hypothetical protein J437_LFUL017360 [Ladona fulva]|uniref:Uncharacterized protein n=1 Tax=Ladona fulva TaxID=123851 RepID=A0A8K0P9K3_LADFU|nr:hypothetical protein J437_LFUL017360 [Ladona fulva]
MLFVVLRNIFNDYSAHADLRDDNKFRQFRHIIYPNIGIICKTLSALRLFLGMDQNNPGINVDSDLSESWTLLDKESSEIGDSVHFDESSNEDAVREEMESSKSISYASDSSYSKLPLECPGTAQNEG